MTENKQISVSFAAVDKYLESNIVKNEQKELRGTELISYGDRNIYPYYLYNLYQNVSTLKSLINGLADYVVGENVTINLAQFTKLINKNETIEDLVHNLVIDLLIYGGFALNVIRDNAGNINSIYNLDFKRIRSDKKNTKFYYSEDWYNKSIGRAKATVYPAYDPGDPGQKSSIFYYKNDKDNTYPTPIWGGAVISAEVLKHIGEFHLNSLYNGISSDYIVNFNSGIPSDEQKDEIETSFNEKYSGFDNGSRSMLSFNSDFSHRTTVEAIPQSNFIDRYNSLYQTSLKELFTSFRVHPALFGLPTENTGFNSQDLAEAFKITNTTVVLPLQKTIKRQFEKIFQVENVIEIKPLNISFGEDETTVVEDSTSGIVQ